MKHFCVFFLCAVLSMAAEFTTGQAGRAVVGQTTFTGALAGASQSLIGAASGLAYKNDTLFVADSNRLGASPVNNRILIYQHISSMFPPPNQQPPGVGQRCPACGGTASVVLGQTDFTKTDPAASQSGMQLPTDVATDGLVLAVADTNNNRVLIWKTIPASNNAPADVVVGQPDFKSTLTTVPPTAKSMRGPQGVWIQDGKLYVADTQNHRVLIYNSIPTSNGAAADLVLGQPDFTTFVEPDLTQAKSDAKADNLLNPVSVTSDGVRLYITDLGHNRVLIWNSLPAKNAQPADLALGQPDLTSSIPNNAFTGSPATSSTDTTNKETPVMCTVSVGKDLANNPAYPGRCSSTLSFPRYALSDGTWLFVADGGNDRVLVYRHVPTASGAAPDIILGQADGLSDEASTASDRLQTPTSLAWDGANLYVADTYNRRVMIYSPAEPSIPQQGVRNAASFQIFALGGISLGGTINENDEVTITIAGTDYKYKVLKADTFATVVAALVNAINGSNNGAGDPNALATANVVVQGILLTSRKPGTDGNSVTLATTVSSGAKITATASGANLAGGQDAAQIGLGSLITIYGKNLSDGTGSEPGTGKYLPHEIAGTRVYIDGSAAHLLYVSPTQINAQMPIGFTDASSVSLYVWTRHADGTVTVTTPVAVTLVPENPGIFAESGKEPRPAVVFHGSPFASGTVSVDGSINAGDVGTIKIEDRSYTYTVKSTDTLSTVRDGLVAVVNKDPKVSAVAAGAFTRVRLFARKAGTAGQGITYSASISSGAKLLLTATGAALCCANTGQVTKDKPAIPGETITIYATGLGLIQTPMTGYETGRRYDGPINSPLESVSSLAGGKTANVLLASPLPGSVGIFQVQLELNSDLPTDPLTQLTIAQFLYVSNIVTFPVKKP
jgi:uncharacterized protein (TIGR03437 family)